jgi:hypothetical protein
MVGFIMFSIGGHGHRPRLDRPGGAQRGEQLGLLRLGGLDVTLLDVAVAADRLG